MSEVIVSPPSFNKVVIQEAGGNLVTTINEGNSVATVIAQGPQGPPGLGGINIDGSAKIDKSVLYYDSAAAVFKADAVWTTLTISDGGNF